MVSEGHDNVNNGSRFWLSRSPSQPWLLVVFSIAFALFVLLPAFLVGPFPLDPLMSWGDALDVATPIVLIPIYGFLFGVSGGLAGGSSTLTFFVLVAVWVEGQGMHLAANSIGHLLKGTPASEFALLTHTYDEVLSHYLWHLGVVGLALLVLWQDRLINAPEVAFARLPVSAGGFLHGLLLFIIFVEGQTVALGLPSVILIAVGILIPGRAELLRRPVRVFYLAASLVALALLVSWGFYWHGFPEFSALGFIG